MKPIIMNQRQDEQEIKVGDRVHCGLVGTGGAGYHGTVEKIEGDYVYLRNERTTRFGFQTYRGLLRNCTKY